MKRLFAFLALIVCTLAPSAQESPYITRVYEYRPAPGQFVNELPEYEQGDDAEAMRLKAEDAIAADAGYTITLGGWGGYVVFGFDHMVPNITDSCDLLIRGNAFYSDKSHPEKGGSSEPGIIYVSYDANSNGLPDDTWYEIAGSESARADRSYGITYFRTPEQHVPTPGTSASLVDTSYIAWQDIYGANGYMAKNSYHTQSYYPLWLSDDHLDFEGTLLPPNAVSYEEEGYTKYVMMNYAYGYADNHPNNTPAAQINIQWAVDRLGRPANLPGIHFVRIQTGTHQQCGWIGEISTEVCGATDLHAIRNTAIVPTPLTQSPKKVLHNGHLYIRQGSRIYYLM